MTPFGKMLRQERKDHAMSLGAMAEKLGLSTPYLSQIETGAKPATSRIISKIIELFQLSASDAEALTRAAAKSVAVKKVESITIDLRADASERDRQLASHLAFSFNRLSPTAKRRLQEMLKDETNG